MVKDIVDILHVTRYRRSFGVALRIGAAGRRKEVVLKTPILVPRSVQIAVNRADRGHGHWQPDDIGCPVADLVRIPEGERPAFQKINGTAGQLGNVAGIPTKRAHGDMRDIAKHLIPEPIIIDHLPEAIVHAAVDEVRDMANLSRAHLGRNAESIAHHRGECSHLHDRHIMLHQRSRDRIHRAAEYLESRPRYTGSDGRAKGSDWRCVTNGLANLLAKGSIAAAGDERAFESVQEIAVGAPAIFIAHLDPAAARDERISDGLLQRGASALAKKNVAHTPAKDRILDRRYGRLGQGSRRSSQLAPRCAAQLLSSEGDLACHGIERHEGRMIPWSQERHLDHRVASTADGAIKR